MKTLTKLELRNYRSHENSVIEFGRLTSIIGENDAGKSNCYKALDRVLNNAPFSDAQLRYGTKEGSVKVTFSDGSWIERTRKGTKQTCTLSTNPSNPYETIKDVTEIVQAFTGFKPVTIDKNKTAESVQLVPIDAGQTYLVGGTAADGVLRRITRLMSGAGIETARIVLDKELRALEKLSAVEENNLSAQQRVVDCLEDEAWAEIEADLLVTEAKLNRLDKLEEAESVLTEFQDVASIAGVVMGARETFSTTLEDMYALRTAIAKVNPLLSLQMTLQMCDTTICDSLESLNVAYAKDETLTAQLETLKLQLDAAKVIEEAARQAKRDAEHAEELRHQAELSRQREETAAQRLADEAKATKFCPTCKRKL